MSVDSKTFLKIAWMLSSVSCFVFPLAVVPFEAFGSSHTWLKRVGLEMMFGMIVLSFPSGLLLLLALAFVVEIFFPFEAPVSSYVLLWFGLFVAGYLQWFHFLPHLLEKKSWSKRQSLTTLGLDKGNEEDSMNQRRRRGRQRKEKAAWVQLTSKDVVRFDEVRRTPLERVIGGS